MNPSFLIFFIDALDHLVPTYSIFFVIPLYFGHFPKEPSLAIDNSASSLCAGALRPKGETLSFVCGMTHQVLVKGFQQDQKPGWRPRTLNSTFLCRTISTRSHDPLALKRKDILGFIPPFPTPPSNGRKRHFGVCLEVGFVGLQHFN